MAHHVQVVLTEHLPHVGESGQLVRVKSGFARNFLIPRGLAAMATKDNVKKIDHEKRMAIARAVKLRGHAEEQAAKLKGVKLVISAKVGEEDKLYGSVTSRDLEDALRQQGFEIDRRKIVMDPIRELGEHTVSIKIALGVDVAVAVTVEALEA